MLNDKEVLASIRYANGHINGDFGELCTKYVEVCNLHRTLYVAYMSHHYHLNTKIQKQVFDVLDSSSRYVLSMMRSLSREPHILGYRGKAKNRNINIYKLRLKVADSHIRDIKATMHDVDNAVHEKAVPNITIPVPSTHSTSSIIVAFIKQFWSYDHRKILPPERRQ
jgi:hypothetical protein